MDKICQLIRIKRLLKLKELKFSWKDTLDFREKSQKVVDIKGVHWEKNLLGILRREIINHTQIYPFDYYNWQFQMLQ